MAKIAIGRHANCFPLPRLPIRRCSSKSLRLMKAIFIATPVEIFAG